MNPDILRNLLIDEMGRARADAFIDRLQAHLAAAQSRAEAEAAHARLREMERANTLQRAAPTASPVSYEEREDPKPINAPTEGNSQRPPLAS